MVPLFLHSGSFGCHESPEASALVGVVSMEVGVSFAARRERYTSGSGPFSRLRVPGRLLMYHDSTRQRDCKTGCWSMTEASFQAIRWSSLTACSAKALVSMLKLSTALRCSLIL